jgi:hypothetical protein
VGMWGTNSVGFACAGVEGVFGLPTSTIGDTFTVRKGSTFRVADPVRPKVVIVAGPPQVPGYLAHTLSTKG